MNAGSDRNEIPMRHLSRWQNRRSFVVAFGFGTCLVTETLKKGDNATANL